MPVSRDEFRRLMAQRGAVADSGFTQSAQPMVPDSGFTQSAPVHDPGFAPPSFHEVMGQMGRHMSMGDAIGGEVPDALLLPGQPGADPYLDSNRRLRDFLGTAVATTAALGPLAGPAGRMLGPPMGRMAMAAIKPRNAGAMALGSGWERLRALGRVASAARGPAAMPPAEPMPAMPPNAVAVRAPAATGPEPMTMRPTGSYVERVPPAPKPRPSPKPKAEAPKKPTGAASERVTKPSRPRKSQAMRGASNRVLEERTEMRRKAVGREPAMPDNLEAQLQQSLRINEILPQATGQAVRMSELMPREQVLAIRLLRALMQQGGMAGP